MEAESRNPGSVLSLTRRAVALRRRLHADGLLEAGDAVELELTGDDVLLARRPSGFTVVMAMGNSPARLPAGEVLLASGETSGGSLPADAAAWVLASE